MTDSGKRVGLAWGTLSLCGSLVLLGCSGAEPEKAVTSAVSSDGVILCGELPGLEPGATRPQQEWYSLIAINNKLRHFPEFAATTGFESVSDCAQARDFYDRYVEYSELHPGFDDGEPIEAPPLERDLPPPETRGRRAEVQKLMNGSPDLLMPVVKLERNDGGTCTGSFIGRNFILTAAHCMDTEPGWETKPDPEKAAKVNRWRPYTVTWGGPSGVPSRVNIFWNVRQYVDPRYVGFRQPSKNAAINFDQALLYVYDQDDDQLPNNIPNPTSARAPFMRMSLRAGINGAQAQAWGWGAPDDTKLNRAVMANYNLVSEVGATSRIIGTVPPGTGVPYMCVGDSGGPLTDRYDIPNPTTGVPEPQFVIVATMVAKEEPPAPPPPAPPPPKPQCNTVPGYKDYWVRTDESAHFFIEPIVKLWYFFPCFDKKSATAAVDDYVECWGKSCKDTSECGLDEVCSHAGKELLALGSGGCAGCASGLCDCMYGQCLKKPPKDD